MIRRDILGQIVFDEPEKRCELENILHPVVRQDQKKFLRDQRLKGRKVAALDIPLLFETKAQNRVDYTLVVTAPYTVQRRRVLARPGMDEDRFLSVLNAQMPDAQKRAQADFVVQTGLGLGHTYGTLRAILKKIAPRSGNAYKPSYK